MSFRGGGVERGGGVCFSRLVRYQVGEKKILWGWAAEVEAFVGGATGKPGCLACGSTKQLGNILTSQFQKTEEHFGSFACVLFNLFPIGSRNRSTLQ